MTIGLIVLAVWALLFMVVLALCRASGRADDLGDRLTAAELPAQSRIAATPLSEAMPELVPSGPGGPSAQPAAPAVAGSAGAPRRPSRFRPARVPTRAVGG